MLTLPIIRLKGNRVQCLKWLGIARAKLAALVLSMERARLLQNRLVLRPRPGVLIICSKSFNITRILIAIEGGVREKIIEKLKWYWYTILTGGTLRYLLDVAVDGVRSVWVCGGYSSSLTPETQFGDRVLIAKHDVNGLLLFSKTIIRQTEFEFATSICIDPNGIFFTLDHYSANNDTNDPPEYPTYDSALVKINKSGLVAWSTKIGLLGTKINHVDSHVVNGSIYTCCKVLDFTNYPTLDQRYIGSVNKFSSEGSLIWKRIFYYNYDVVGEPSATSGALYFEKLAVTPNNDSYVACRDMGDDNYLPSGQGTVIKLNYNGVPQWVKQLYSTVTPDWDNLFWITDIVTDEFSMVYALCVDMVPSKIVSEHGEFIYHVIKLNSSGAIQWQRGYTIPFEDNEGAYVPGELPRTYARLSIDRHGGIYILTESFALVKEVTATGNVTIPGHVLFKYSSIGELLWQRSMSSSAFEVDLGRIVVDQDGDILITGDTKTTLQGFTIKLPGTGGFIGKHLDMKFTDPGVEIINSGVLIRAGSGNLNAPEAGDMYNGTMLYSTSIGTYETIDLELTGETNKILIEKTTKLLRSN